MAKARERTASERTAVLQEENASLRNDLGNLGQAYLKVCEENMLLQEAYAKRYIENDEFKKRLAESEEQRKIAEQNSLTDTLTGIHNLRYVLEQMDILQYRTTRDESFSDNEICVIVVDANRMKDINDTHGHPVGNLALKALAEKLVSTSRKGDIVARIGGDEFVVIIVIAKEHPVGTVELARRIALAVKNIPLKLTESTAITVSASVGYECQKLDSNFSFNDMLARADAAMYKVKKNR